MADQFTNINNVNDNQRSGDQYASHKQGQPPSHGRSHPYNVHQNTRQEFQHANHGAPTSSNSGYSNTSHGRQQGHGPAIQNDRPSHQYGPDSQNRSNYQQGPNTSQGQGHNGSYPKSREMPPQSKGNSYTNRGNYTAGYTAKNTSGQNTGMSEPREGKTSDKSYPGGLDTRSRTDERSRGESRSKSSAPPPPTTQTQVNGASYANERGQGTGDGQGRYVNGRDQGRPMTSEPHIEGGASYPNKNMNNRYMAENSGQKYQHKEDAKGSYESRDTRQRGYDNKGYVQNDYRDGKSKQQPAQPHHQSTGDVNYTNTGHYNNTRSTSDRNRGQGNDQKNEFSKPAFHQSAGNVSHPNAGHYANSREVVPAGSGHNRYYAAEKDQHGQRNQALSAHDIPNQVKKSSEDTMSMKPKDPRYQGHHQNHPQAPPRRNKSSSATDINSQVYSPSNQNLHNAGMPDKSAAAQQGSSGKEPYRQNRENHTSYRNEVSTPNNLSQSQTVLNNSQAQTKDQTPPYSSQQLAQHQYQQTSMRVTNSGNRDRVVSDSSSSTTRKYEKNMGGTQTSKHTPSNAPAAKRRDRMSSSLSTAQQPRPSSYHGTAPPQKAQYFDPTPPDRSMSMVAIPQAGTAGLSSSGVSGNPNGRDLQHQPPLARASSLPTISQQVSQNQHNASMSAIHNPGLYRSKSLLSVALQGAESSQYRAGATNLRHSASLASLVASNPNLARTASTYALYELEVEKGNLPKDHFVTIVLSIVSIVIMPLIGWIWGSLSLYLTGKILRNIFPCIMRDY